MNIERLKSPASNTDLGELAELLVDAVTSGAAVSFLGDLTLDRARDWWRETIASAPPRTVFLVARDSQGIVGSVQVHPTWAPNQPHRGEITKLLVHRRGQRQGIASRLMQGIEVEALREGLTLLVLDTKRGGPAETLYRQLGWNVVGIIPRFALDPDGVTLHDTVVFYKELSGKVE